MEYYELSPSQKNIDELRRFCGKSAVTNICGAVIFDELFDTELLVQAVTAAAAGHEALRLGFVTRGGRTVQFVRSAPVKPCCMAFSSAEEMMMYGRQQAEQPFDAVGGEMCRLTVFTLPGSCGAMLCASHLIADAWTYTILAGEVYDAVKALAAGELPREHELRRYTPQTEKYEAYRLSGRYGRDMRFWSERYSEGIEETPARAARGVTDDPGALRIARRLPGGLSRAADAFCSENGISAAALFESVMLIYLSGINGGDRAVTIGVPVLGRSGAEEKRTAGVFIHTIPLTVKTESGETAAALCKRVFSEHMEIYRHRQLPFSEIRRAVREKTGFSGRLFDVMVSFQNAATNIPARTEWFSNGCCELPLSLHIDDRDSAGRYTVTADLRREVFTGGAAEAELFLGRITDILRTVTEDGSIPVGEIPLLPQNERDIVVRRFNETSEDYDREMTVHCAFSRKATACPEKTALVFRGRKYSYSELEDKSDSLAALLLDKGIGAGDVVPIISRRSPYMIIAMLAVLKTGAAYMPLSPDYPLRRTEYMIKSVGAAAVLTFGCGSEIETAEVIRLEEAELTAKCRAVPPAGRAGDICYLIFTSGSTGKPKAAAVTHRNVMNYCAVTERSVCGGIIGSGTGSIVSVTDFVFDIFVTESIMALLNGLTVILADDVQASSQRALAELITDSGAEVLQTTPTKLRSLLFETNCRGYLSQLKCIILGGEELPSAFCRELMGLTDAAVYNIYGPAETTVWSSFDRADPRDMTIGRPIANTRIYILDSRLRPMPIGTEGEICIAGDGVGAGYPAEPALTAERFVPDPFLPGERLYRTGDMGLIRTDGRIEFLGRRDGQVKLRGLRIELGEIEAVMSCFDGIELAAAAVRQNAAGESYIAGWYVSSVGIDEAALVRYMSAGLPSYMIPSRFMALEKMPMTKSGKTDRRALPDIPAPGSESGSSEPLSTEEACLCGIMAEVLGIPRAGAGEDFFALGGDSFSALRLVSEAEEKGFGFSVRDVYEMRTARALCGLRKGGVRESSKTLAEYPLQRGAFEAALFRLFGTLTMSFYRFGVTGLGNIDPRGRYIVCPNHESDLDCMWVWTALSGGFPLSATAALIAEEHLSDPLHKLIFRLEGGIPIDRRGDFSPALERAAEVISEGGGKRLLLVHPEGTRTRTGRLGSFRQGAALLSIRTGTPILPVYISGARRIYPAGKSLPSLFDSAGMRRYPLRINFGKPIFPAGRTAEELTAETRRQVEAMKKARKKQ